jgi:predicted branched-subunit amino acid permease
VKVVIERPLVREGGAVRYFMQGFIAMIPLWFAALPSGSAYGLAAHSAGFSPATTQVLSLLVFSAAGQIGALALFTSGAAPLVSIGTVVILNAQLLLLGLTIGRQLHPTWATRLLLAPFLTDGAFAVAAARGPLRLPALLGAGLSMYVAWNVGTAVGIAAGQLLPDPARFGSDFALPLVFLALLIPLIRTWATLYVALAAGAMTLLLEHFISTGLAILGAALVASTVGTVSSRDETQPIGEQA